MSKNRTMRKPNSDLSGTDYSVNESLENMLAAESTAAYKRPWHRLDRGLRLNRLKGFAETLATSRGIKPHEQVALMQLLTKALDRKILNSKTNVLYDMEKEEITEIKPLIMHQNAQGEILFQILEKRNAVTFRKRPSSTEGAPSEVPS